MTRSRTNEGIHRKKASCTTVLSTIPRARQRAKAWIYYMGTILDRIVTILTRKVGKFIDETEQNTHNIHLHSPYLPDCSLRIGKRWYKFLRCYCLYRRRPAGSEPLRHSNHCLYAHIHHRSVYESKCEEQMLTCSIPSTPTGSPSEQGWVAGTPCHYKTYEDD